MVWLSLLVACCFASCTANEFAKPVIHPKGVKPLGHDRRTGLYGLVPPAELKMVDWATDLTIPALGGKHLLVNSKTPNKDNGLLTREITAFSLKKGHSNYFREIHRMTGQSTRMYLSKKSNLTYIGRTYLYDPMQFQKKPAGVIHLDKASAAMRVPPLSLMLNDATKITYEVKGFYPHCENQKPDSTEPLNGEKLYSFGRIIKTPLGPWRVVRIDCDTAGDPRGVEAYTITKREHGWEAASESVGIIGLVQHNSQSEGDLSNGWLTRGEDPLLFSAVMMVMDEPQTAMG